MLPAYSADNTLQVTRPPTEFVIGDPKNSNPEIELKVLVNGPASGVLRLQIVDFVYGANGTKDKLPAGSTPYSLTKIFDVSNLKAQYSPTKRSQQFVFKLVPKLKKIDAIYFGGLKVVMDPAQGSGKQKSRGANTTAAAIVNVLTVTPFGWTGGTSENQLKPAVVENLTFTSANRTGPIDYLLPDLPGLINAGPVEAKVTYKNPGELPTFVTATWKFSQGGKVLANRGGAKVILLAGAKNSQSVITQSAIAGTDSYANVLPTFGLVDAEVQVASELGGTKFDPVVKKSTFLVVQWKEPFFFTALAVVAFWYLLRKRPSADGSKKRKEPSLAWLALVALRKWVGKKLKKQRS